MQLIFNNPYRILGILVGATDREKSRQVRLLKRYISDGQDPPPDFSFPALGRLPNAIDAIDEANLKLYRDSDKMNAALFWFYTGNEITDEAAFEALKDGDTNSAMRIWEKLIFETKDDGKRDWKAITEKNHSAFHNWFILGFLNKTNWSWSLIANMKFLESDYWIELKKRATDITSTTTKKELQLNFLNSIVNEIENRRVNFSLNELTNLIKNESFSAKQDFLTIIAQKLKANINAHIENARKQRTANKTEAAKAGENLYKQTKSDLEQIKSILGTDNLSYSNVADKVANEILQCSIDYFNDSQEKDADNNYHAHATKLVKLAQSIAVGGVVKGRSKENLDTLEGMKDREINNAIHILQLIKKVYDDVRYDFHRSVNTDKINEMLQDVFTNKNCRKIESCQNYFLLNEYITLLNSIINKSSNYYWLKTHCNTVITLKNQIIIQQILFIAKSRTDKDGVAYIIEILKEAAKYDLSVINELITKEITDTIIEKIALNNNQTLIKEFYDIAIKNHTLQLRVEKIFAEKLPNSSALKSQILRQIETRKKQEEERKEKNRIASLWYNNPKRWSDFSDWIPEGCLSAGILSLPIIPIFAILVIIYGIYRLMAVIARSINS